MTIVPCVGPLINSRHPYLIIVGVGLPPCIGSRRRTDSLMISYLIWTKAHRIVGVSVVAMDPKHGYGSADLTGHLVNMEKISPRSRPVALLF